MANLIVTGTCSPDVTGIYFSSGGGSEYVRDEVYELVNRGGYYAILTVGDNVELFTCVTLLGTYTAVAPATGSVVVAEDVPAFVPFAIWL